MSWRKPAVDKVLARMSTNWSAGSAFQSSASVLANAIKSLRKRNLPKIEIATAQNLGTRLWTSCTRLKTREIKSRKKS